MWNFSLRNPVNFDRIYTCKPWLTYKSPQGTEEIFVVEDYVTAFGTFQTNTLTSAGTVTVVTSPLQGSIAVTDIIISAEKAASGAEIELRFTDGTDNQTLIKQDVGNQNLEFSHTVKGRMQGWKDARLDLILTSANTNVFVTVGYVPLPTGLDFTSWDALR